MIKNTTLTLHIIGNKFNFAIIFLFNRDKGGYNGTDKYTSK